MYQVQILTTEGEWVNVGEPTVAYRTAADDATQRRVWQRVDARVVCVDDAVGPGA